MSSLGQVIDRTSRSFMGQLVQPGDAGYDAWRRVHNGLIDKHPAAIARCHGVADVVDAVRLARAAGLEVAVRGGGHNVAGLGTIEGGLLIDLSLMKGIHVDVANRTARAEGGVLWNEFNRETQVHGLATTGGVVGSTGIAGLTLGGGIGWLMPQYGLALDNLTSMRISSGQFVAAAATSASPRPWSTTSTRSAPSSPAASWRIRSHARETC
jgi:FAD/FMN-containing dehydrogenase